MRVIEADDVHRVLEFPTLIEALRSAFARPAGVPRRMLFRLAGEESRDEFALLPAWTDDVIGVKAFTYLPENASKGLDILYSKILLFDRQTGQPLALVDGTSVTLWRTAAASALAADYLARPDARRLLVCGTGNLAPYMALAHASVRPIERIGVWGRREERAAKVVEELRRRRPDLEIEAATDLEAEARNADVISSATASRQPILFGDWVQPGTHVDLVGNHHRDCQECDTELVVKARVFVDSRANALNETGDLLIPIAEGRITEAHVIGELADLCSGAVPGRTSGDQVTLFKSVGTALSDLAAARLVTELV